MERTKKQKKRVLLVEDDIVLSKHIKELLEAYEPELELHAVENAGEAWPHIFPKHPAERPDAVILDIMIPYGAAAKELGAESDPDCIQSGLRLLEKLRDWEKTHGSHDDPLPPLWVSVITARSNPKLIEEINSLLMGRGKLYLKPYKGIVLEHDLMFILGIECKAPEVLLPRGYKPPGGEEA